MAAAIRDIMESDPATEGDLVLPGDEGDLHIPHYGVVTRSDVVGALVA